MLDKYTIYVHRKNQLLTNYQIQLFTLRPAGPLLISEADWIKIPLHTYFKCRFTLLLWSNHFRSERVANRGGSSLLCKEGYRFSMGWCMREPYCPLSSAVCNATIPTLPLFEMAESACSPFCYVLHLTNIKHFPCWNTVISTRVELGKREIVWKHDARRAEYFHTISSFPNFHECWYNYISIRKKCFIFFL
jgi:hypothetical protein